MKIGEYYKKQGKSPRKVDVCEHKREGSSRLRTELKLEWITKIRVNWGIVKKPSLLIMFFSYEPILKISCTLVMPDSRIAMMGEE